MGAGNASLGNSNGSLTFTTAGSGMSSLMSLSAVPAANFLRWGRVLTFTDLVFASTAHEELHTFKLLLRNAESDASIELAINSEGSVLLEERFGALGVASLAEHQLPVECARTGLQGSLALGFDSFELHIGCSLTSDAVFSSSGGHAVDMGDVWEGNGDANVTIRFESGNTSDVNTDPSRAGPLTTTLGALTIVPVDYTDMQLSRAADIRKPKPAKQTVLPAVLGPNVNGISLRDAGLGVDQPMAALGYVDVTKPPFSADPSGKADATSAIQKAANFAMEHYLVTFFPGNVP
jgi:hypothetical protein